ncbi:MAG: ATP-binding protein, partial [Rudaea sp.]
LFLMHGYSGSGKTHLSGELMLHWPALRVRSDVERKRMLGLGAAQTTRSAFGAGAYSQDTTAATYEHLIEVAETAVQGGFSVIVDAACLRRQQRQLFRALARTHDMRFVIVDCVAAEPELRSRLRRRSVHGTDASEADEAILDQQLQFAEPLDAEENAEAVCFDAAAGKDTTAFIADIRMRLGQA